MPATVGFMQDFRCVILQLCLQRGRGFDEGGSNRRPQFEIFQALAMNADQKQSVIVDINRPLIASECEPGMAATISARASRDNRRRFCLSNCLWWAKTVTWNDEVTIAFGNENPLLTLQIKYVFSLEIAGAV